MSSMKQTDKKKSPPNNQAKRPARVETREIKLQQEKSNKTLRPKETDKKASSTRVNSCIGIRDTNKSAKAFKTLQVTNQENRNIHNKPSIDLDKEQNDVREESDTETVTDSLSTSGDSRVTEEEKVESPLKVSSNMSMKTKRNTKESPNSIAKYSIGNNLKSLKDHPKPPSTPSSISSEVFDGQDLEDEASNGLQSDDETLHAEENTKDLKIAQMELRIEKLEDELREVAALEISLYSVVQEHGHSPHKVHTPAQRLFRLYVHAHKNLSLEKQTTIARNIVSGLVLISKSCGNDVSRLTFWWSNIIVLRELISQTFGSKQSNNPDVTSELEEVESEIFSQIVETIWCQTLRPNMLTNETVRKLAGPTLGDQQQNNFSINIWQNAFQDAFRRLCPVHAEGHECDCLPVLAKMVMEHFVARLDVAMFNAILRDSSHEIPNRVLPIPAGDLSFGSGARLKKAVGNWSRWLTNRFSVDTNVDHTTNEVKWFQFLNSLSGVLMVPKDMLMDKSIRDEVCPSISLVLLKRILDNFTPDEFCPDPVPNTVLEALNVESIIECGLSEDNSNSFPNAAAATIIYKPPSSIDVAEACENTRVSRSESMIQTNGYPSDEKLKVLDSSPTFIIENFRSVNRNIASYVGANSRYELFREVWSS